MSNLHIPDDLSDAEASQLEALIVATQLRERPEPDIVIDRVPLPPWMQTLMETVGKPTSYFVARHPDEGEFDPPHDNTDELASTISKMEAQFYGLDSPITPVGQDPDGVNISLEELKFSGRIIRAIGAIDKLCKQPQHATDLEVAEVVLRNTETNELVGSVVRLSDGTLVYNKDAS